ncbi:4-phosphoerythronate dehydrogenase [Kiritimatiellota bacterium B12222]|nr:4-phosphoerythronate dehydrogenase [Kiritimatiellota bacterium B12222]
MNNKLEICNGMKIICASSVSFGREAFSSLGSCEFPAEGDICPEMVATADAVITRSKTKLNADLLGESTVRFAGTCTAGVDHVDLEALETRSIHFASAPGCNANGVSEYVLAALLEKPGFSFAGKTVGIIGHGQVGTRVEKKLRALGCKVLLNDPPKEAGGADGPYTSLSEMLPLCDVVTLHVPLVERGDFPTRDLLGAAQIASMKQGAILINACRGEVLDAAAVIKARGSSALSWLVLDVWDPEPQIPEDLLVASDLATPHIAGHSVEGKVNGTRQIREQLVEFFKLDVASWDPEPLMPAPEHQEVDISGLSHRDQRLAKMVKACYDIRSDDQALREAKDDRAASFVQQRRNYRNRREFAATRLVGVPEEEVEVFRSLGFQI